MHRLLGIGLCILLIALSCVHEADANIGVPAPSPKCVGTCCQQAGPIDFVRICNTQYALFKGGDGIPPALVGISLASSMSSAAFALNEDNAACVLRNSLSQLGADFKTTRFFFHTQTPVTVGGKTTALTGGATVFTAASAVYVVFSGFQTTNGFSKATTNYVIGGATVQVSALFNAYYNLFRAPGADIIEEAVSQYNAAPLTSIVNGNITTPRRLFIAGWSAGAVSSLFAALDLQARGITADYVYTFGQEKPGYANFVDAYMATVLGNRTTAWWNALDIQILSPPATAAQRSATRAALQTNADKQLYSTWGKDGKYTTLPVTRYWRIAPALFDIVPVNSCLKPSTDPRLAPLFNACPTPQADPTLFNCSQNFADHDHLLYFKKIKNCASVFFTRGVIPPPGRYVFSCFNNLPLPSGY